MKVIVFLGLVVLATAQYYETPNDKFDYAAVPFEELKQHMVCMLDKGPCTAMDASQRKDGPEAIRTECAKCSPDLKLTFLTFLNRVSKELPSEFEEYKKKYDPENIHIQRLMDELNRHASKYSPSS